MEYASNLDSRQSKKKKIDPSFKSKRYRDKLRAEVKALENLIPVDRQSLTKKLDSQTVYRLAIAYLRVKSYLKARNPRVEYANTNNITEIHQYINGVNVVEQVNDFKVSGKTPGETNELNTDVRNIQDSGRSGKVDESTLNDLHIIEKSLDATTLFQIIDGFALLASTDGTIMFVTDNVSKFTGFSQVDLIHRCLYSIVHPEDLQTVKNSLETRFKSDADDRLSSVSPDNPPREKIKDFFYKIRCYHGNNPGYIKLHCSGVLYHLPEMPNTYQTSKSVTLLYCQPFILTGNDVIDDKSREVFWSKHDLDLKFKEIEDLSPLGYTSADLCEKSLYQIVHPDDLCVLSHVHKEVTRVTEVQTFFCRLESKRGDWLWVYCKGKVICKNSKRFSIVFSHCPVRDDNNVFIKQETLCRRHRLASVFQYLKLTHMQPHQYGNHFECQLPIKQRSFASHNSNQGFESVLKQEENTHAPVISEMFCVPCPSFWHEAIDRHSPVLPSSHAAQKSFQRERQLYIADSRRKKCVEQNMTSMTSSSHRTNFATTSVGFYDESFSKEVISHTNLYPHHSNYNFYSTCIPSYMEYKDDNVRSRCTHFDKYECHKFNQGSIDFQQYYPAQTNLYSENVSNWGNLEQLYDAPKWLKHQNNIQEFGYRSVAAKRYLVSPNIYSSANVRFSMVCESEFDIYDSPSQNKVIRPTEMHDNSLSIYNTSKELPDFKAENDYSNCCAKPGKVLKTEKQPVKYDVEASVFMRIVEAPNTESNITLVNFPACNYKESSNVKTVCR